MVCLLLGHFREDKVKSESNGASTGRHPRVFGLSLLDVTFALVGASIVHSLDEHFLPASNLWENPRIR